MKFTEEDGPPLPPLRSLRWPELCPVWWLGSGLDCVVTVYLCVFSLVVMDMDGRIYVRAWQGGVLSGGFEKNPKPIFTEGRNQLEIQTMQEDWDHFGKRRGDFSIMAPCSVYVATATVKHGVHLVFHSDFVL